MINIFDGEKLKDIRKSKGLTTQQVADQIGISQSYVSRFENNKAIPDVDMLATILDVYEVSICDFFSTANTNKLDNHTITLLNNLKKLTPEQLDLLNKLIINLVSK